MKILNLTQHSASVEQLEAGIVDLPDELHTRLAGLLTFTELPSEQELEARAEAIYMLVTQHIAPQYSEEQRQSGDVESQIRELGWSFMLGGAPFFMAHLVEEMRHIGKCGYAFSERVSEEKNGVKTSKFVHKGMVWA